MSHLLPLLPQASSCMPTSVHALGLLVLGDAAQFQRTAQGQLAAVGAGGKPGLGARSL